MSAPDALRAVAAHGLHDPPMGGLASLRPADVVPLLDRATAHKLVGLLDQAFADGVLPCDEDGATHIGTRAVEVAAWSVQLERHVLLVDALLDEHGLPHRFVKGSTVAHRFYDHPGLRMSVDVDLLVPSPWLERAVDVLVAADHVRVQRDPYPGFSRRYAKSVTVRHRSDVEVDVHRVIPDGPFGLRALPDALWVRPPAWVAIGDRDVPCLDPVAAFVQAGVNAVASYDLVALASLRDVVQIGTTVADQIPEVHDLAGALGVRACVAEATALAMDTLAWEPGPSLAEVARWPISARERQWLDSYRHPTSDRQRAWLGVQAVPGAFGKVAYLGSVAALLAGRPFRRRARTGPAPVSEPGSNA